MRNKNKVKHIPYKSGQILLGPKLADGSQSKIQIIKHNDSGHYKVAIYFIDSHDTIAQVYSNIHHNSFDKAKLTLGLSGVLKRL